MDSNRDSPSSLLPFFTSVPVSLKSEGSSTASTASSSSPQLTLMDCG